MAKRKIKIGYKQKESILPIQNVPQYGWNSIDPPPYLNTTPDDLVPKNPLTKKRYLELMKIASEVLDFLDKNKVDKKERCTVRYFAEDMSNRNL